MSYIEKQLYLWKLHEETSNKPRRQQIPQYVAPISRRAPQPPIMNPYFKPPRYKKHVNEAPTQHTNHNARTHQHDRHLSSMLQHNHLYSLCNPLHSQHQLNHQLIKLSLHNQTKPPNHIKPPFLHQLKQRPNEHQCPNDILILLRSHNCIVCHQPHDQRELDTAQLIINIISYHQCSNQG